MKVVGWRVVAFFLWVASFLCLVSVVNFYRSPGSPPPDLEDLLFIRPLFGLIGYALYRAAKAARNKAESNPSENTGGQDLPPRKISWAMQPTVSLSAEPIVTLAVKPQSSFSSVEQTLPVPETPEEERASDWIPESHAAALRKREQLKLESKPEDRAFTYFWLEVEKVLIEAQDIGFTISHHKRHHSRSVVLKRHNNPHIIPEEHLALTWIDYGPSICAEFRYREIYFAVVPDSSPIMLTFKGKRLTCSKAARLILEPFLFEGIIPPRQGRGRLSIDGS